MIGVETPHVDVEGADDRRDVTDVVGVGMGQYDRVESAEGGVDPLDSVEVTAGVDENGPVAVDEKGVAGEGTDTPGDVSDGGHTIRSFRTRLDVFIVDPSTVDGEPFAEKRNAKRGRILKTARRAETEVAGMEQDGPFVGRRPVDLSRLPA